MRAAVALFFALLLLPCCVSYTETRIQSLPKDQILRIRQATVALVDLMTDEPYCSGVIVEFKLLTAAHCVRRNGIDSKFILVRTFDNQIHIAVISKTDRTHDIAILTYTDIPVGLTLSRAEPEVGDRVLVAGHPMGLEWSVLPGYVSHPSRDGGAADGQHWLQTNIGFAPGNSGGPCVGPDGGVWGVASFRIKGFADMGACTHPDDLRAMWW